jgi:hypothetical protein
MAHKLDTNLTFSIGAVEVLSSLDKVVGEYSGGVET